MPNYAYPRTTFSNQQMPWTNPGATWGQPQQQNFNPYSSFGGQFGNNQGSGNQWGGFGGGGGAWGNSWNPYMAGNNNWWNMSGLFDFLRQYYPQGGRESVNQGGKLANANLIRGRFGDGSVVTGGIPTGSPGVGTGNPPLDGKGGM